MMVPPMKHGPFLSSHDKRSRLLPGTGLLVPLLAATLLLALYLGWQALDAVRSHREAAESALLDYGRMAAWQYTGIARDRLDDVFHDLMSDVPRARRATRSGGYWGSDEWIVDEMREELAALRCECPLLHDPGIVFRIDLETRRAQMYGGDASEAALRQLTDSLVERHVDLYRHRYALVALPPGTVLEDAAAVAYGVTEEADGRTTLFGFVTPVSAWGELFGRWFQRNSLLPPAITGETPNDSLLHVTVRSPDGAPVFESAVPYATTMAASDTMVHEFGPFIVSAAVRQDAAARLIIGGLPQSKLPLIIGLLLITLAVGGAALFQLRRERQLAHLRDDFISGVSHELRTPLAQIRMFAELQEAGKLRTEEDRARAISVIHREARRLTHLVDNILRFSRLRRAIATRFLREEIDVAAALDDLIEGFEPLARARAMHVECNVVPDIAIVANADALNQMLVNLLDNAVKYGPRGQTISIAVTREDDTAAFTVCDQGPGIPASERRRIWDAYFRLGRDRESAAPGTGIGLAVVAQLVSMHGGSVSVDDAPGGGACFTLRLPAVRPGSRSWPRAASPQEVGA